MVGEALAQELAEMPKEVQESSIAAMAKSMALAIDSGSANSAFYKVFLETYVVLQTLAAGEEQEGRLDDLKSRRDNRRAAS
jgi:hypothetical protein